MKRILSFATLVFATWLAGCSSNRKPPPKPPVVSTLRVTHQLGGTHYRMLAHADLWFQTFGHKLLVLPFDSTMPMKTVEFGKSGDIGPAVDLVVDRDQRLYVIIEDDEVVVLSLATPQSPEIVERISASELGIRPRRFAVVDNELHVTGMGGVVRMRDGKKVYSTSNEVSGIVRCELGLVACVGRRAFRIDDDRFVGSASELISLNDGQGTLIFARQGEQGALVGLMTGDVREIDATKSTIAIPGKLHSIRVVDNVVWFISDTTISGYTIVDRALTNPVHVDAAGGFDIAPLGKGRLAIAGTFGRAIYQLNGNTGANRFVHAQREPSRLSAALTDGRNILAGSHEGLWMYLINSRVEMTSRQFDRQPPEPTRSATVMNSQARINEDGRSVTIAQHQQVETNSVAPFTYSAGEHAMIHCVVAVDGDFWIGHDRGITVLSVQPAMPVRGKQPIDTASARVKGELRVPGPVKFIYPLLTGGGASFVSEYGGFGVAQFVEEPAPSAIK